MPDPLTWTAAEAARALGRSPGWLRQHRAELEAQGFPPPLPLRLGYDPEAAWQNTLDQRAAALGRL